MLLRGILKVAAAATGLLLIYSVTHANAYLIFSVNASQIRSDCLQPVPVTNIERIDIVKLKVISSNLSYSGRMSQLVLRNESEYTIFRVTVIVDYFDSEAKSIFSIPYFGTVDENEQEPSKLRPFIKTVLPKAIAPHETFTLEGTNLESTRIAPTSAEITYVLLQDKKGVGGVFTSRPSTEPLLLNSPAFFEIVNTKKLPDEVWANLSVDERGRVEGVEIKPGQSDDVAQQIKSQLMRWSFFPGTEGFGAVKTHLALRLSFYDEGFPLPASACPITLPKDMPGTFVEVDLRRMEGERWEVLYARRHARGAFSTIVSTTLAEMPNQSSKP
jgi:hypothetical protein